MDEKWLWANYKDGNPDATTEDFRSTVLPQMHIASERGATFYTLFAPCEGMERAVGIVTAMPMNGQFDKIEPHVTWFPWATARNKVETAVAFFEGMRRMWDLFIVANKNDAPFFKRLSDYNVLRIVGVWDRYLKIDGKDEDAYLYQTRRF